MRRAIFEQNFPGTCPCFPLMYFTSYKDLAVIDSIIHAISISLRRPTLQAGLNECNPIPRLFLQQYSNPRGFEIWMTNILSIVGAPNTCNNSREHQLGEKKKRPKCQWKNQNVEKTCHYPAGKQVFEKSTADATLAS